MEKENLFNKDILLKEFMNTKSNFFKQINLDDVLYLIIFEFSLPLIYVTLHNIHFNFHFKGEINLKESVFWKELSSSNESYIFDFFMNNKDVSLTVKPVSNRSNELTFTKILSLENNEINIVKNMKILVNYVN